MDGGGAAERGERQGAESPPGTSLARNLTTLDATLLGIGALMGGGIFVLLGPATQLAGPAVLAVLVLNGLVTLPTLMVYAELGSAFDDTGGGYRWVRTALGQPYGFLAGWLSWFAHAVAGALYAQASASYLTTVLAATGQLPAGSAGTVGRVLTVLVAVTFVALNHRGVKVSARAENGLNGLAIAVVLAFLVAGLAALVGAPVLAQANLLPLQAPGGAWAIVAAMGLTFIAFEGYEIISQTGEEIVDPRRSIPRAIWASFLVVWVLMLLLAVVALGATAVPFDLAASHGWTRSWQVLGFWREHALVRAAGAIAPWTGPLTLGAALLLQLTALNATIYSSSRVAFAMGRHRNLPAAFGAVHPVNRTPATSILASGAIVLVVSQLPLDAVATGADVAFLLLFLLVDASFLRLRHVLPPEAVGYRAPLFPLTPLAGIAMGVVLSLVLVRYELLGWSVAVGWLLVGLALHRLLVHPREAREREVERRAIEVPREPRPERRDLRVLVPVANPATAEAMARLGAAVAEAGDGELLLLNVVTVPDVTPLTEGHRYVPASRELLAAIQQRVAATVPVEGLVRLGHEVPGAIDEAARDEDADVVLLGWAGPGRMGDWLRRSSVHELVEFPPCNVGVVRLRGAELRGPVVVPTRGGPHGPLAVRLGTAAGRELGSPVRLLQVVPPGTEDVGAVERGLRAMARRHGAPGVEVEVAVVPGTDVVGTVLDASRDAGLMVVGATTEPPWRVALLGGRAEALADRFPGSVVLAKVPVGGSPRARRWARRFHRVVRLLRPSR